MLSPDDKPSYWDQQAYQLGRLIKAAADGVPAYNLSGLLYVTSTPFGLLTVPNAMVRGVFDAMSEPGVELPLKEGRLDAHITVFRPEELATIGGASALVNDRGKPFRYSLGRLVEFEPAGWADVAKCWVLQVVSPELQLLRRSYGLSSLPDNGNKPFHITVAIRRRGVLGRSETAKGTVAA